MSVVVGLASSLCCSPADRPVHYAACCALLPSYYALQAYLARVRKQLDCRSVSYVSMNKDSHVLEVPEAACGSVPPVLLLVGQKKGFKRYSSEELQGLVAARTAKEEAREVVEAGVLQVGGSSSSSVPLGVARVVGWGWGGGGRNQACCRWAAAAAAWRVGWVVVGA